MEKIRILLIYELGFAKFDGVDSGRADGTVEKMKDGESCLPLGKS